MVLSSKSRAHSIIINEFLKGFDLITPLLYEESRVCLVKKERR